ncbi:unnamed protein product [Symbiodinium natans]|uniref:Uncharacterized protein n=1 Tax=Symbiodinium natans TaxID=878477 RepID=A0A812G432_9DINO|nr:unnamed protein product [Symbiodinium natans]
MMVRRYSTFEKKGKHCCRLTTISRPVRYGDEVMDTRVEESIEDPQLVADQEEATAWDDQRRWRRDEWREWGRDDWQASGRWLQSWQREEAKDRAYYEEKIFRS